MCIEFGYSVYSVKGPSKINYYALLMIVLLFMCSLVEAKNLNHTLTWNLKVYIVQGVAAKKVQDARPIFRLTPKPTNQLRH